MFSDIRMYCVIVCCVCVYICKYVLLGSMCILHDVYFIYYNTRSSGFGSLMQSVDLLGGGLFCKTPNAPLLRTLHSP